MKLYGYGCPRCGHRQKTLQGAKLANGDIQVRCTRCANVETIQQPADRVAQRRNA